jgi:hypothetical protein
MIFEIRKNPAFWYCMLFAVFILLRLFSSQDAYYISGDEGKYLKGALTFPDYEVWNNQFEVYNPPGLSALFFLSGKLFGLMRGAQIVELIFAVLFFVYCIKWFKLLGKSDEWIWVAMLFISFAHEIIMMAFRLYKEGVYVAVFVMMLYYFHRALRGEEGHYITAALLGIMNALITDHVLLMLPILVLMVIVFRMDKTSIMKATICIVMIAMALLSWYGTRIAVYETNDWYPAGVDGTPEFVRDYSIRDVLSPSGFPNTAIMINNIIGLDIAHMASYIAYLANMEFALIVPNITYNTVHELFVPKQLAFMAIIYLPLALILLFGLWKSFGDLKLNVFFLIMYVILNVFIVYKGYSNRYSLGAILPLVFWFAQGIEALSRKAKAKLANVAQILLLISLIILIPIHLATHRTFVPTMPFVIESQKTADFLKTLPEDGIMSQAGYTPELALLLHPKRVLSLPRTPDNFEALLKQYQVSYVLYGDSYWAKPEAKNKGIVWDYSTIEYIRSHPEQFKLMNTITENEDKVRVYEVTA